MKIKKFKIDIYDWDVTFIEVKSSKDWNAVKKELKKFLVSPEDIKHAKINMKKKNGGEHFFDLNARESLILLYPHTAKKWRNDVLCHEKRHLENRIMAHCGIEDNEASAFLAGYLGRKLI